VNREQGTGNSEQGTGNREQGTGNREQGTENRGSAQADPLFSVMRIEKIFLFLKSDPLRSGI
jgi:hypothetical protein